jgi:phosphoglycolate phosphatase
MVENMTFETELFSLVFDLDGTLIDSFQQISDACNSARNVQGLPVASADFLRNQIGLPVEMLFADLEVTDAKLEELVASFRIELSKSINVNNVAFPFVHETMAFAREAKMTIGVATSKPQALAEAVVANSQLNNLVDFIAGTGILRPKPHPDVINACLTALGKRKSVMVGDRPEDIEAASHAGIPAIGVAQGVFSKSDLFNCGAVKAYQNFEEMFHELSKYPGGIHDYIKQLCR